MLVHAFVVANLLARAVWLGSIVFFTFVVAPLLFAELGPDRAGAAVSRIFPRYVDLSLACGLTALLATTGIPGVLAGRARRVAWSATSAAFLVTGVGAVTVYRSAHDLRAAMAAATGPDKVDLASQFGRAHGIAMALNLLVLILLCVSVVAEVVGQSVATRPDSQT